MEYFKKCMIDNKVFSHPAFETLHDPQKNKEYIQTCVNIFDKLIKTDFNISFNELLKITATEYHNFAGQEFGIPRHSKDLDIIGPRYPGIDNSSKNPPFVQGFTALNKDHNFNIFNPLKIKSPYEYKKYSYYSQFFDYSNPNYLCKTLNTDCGYEFPNTDEAIQLQFPQEPFNTITTYKKLSEENKIKFVCCVKMNNIDLSSFWTIIPKNSKMQQIMSETLREYFYSKLNLDPNIAVYILHTNPQQFDAIEIEINNLYNMLEKDNPNNINIIAQIYWWLSQAMFYMRGSATISDIICRALLYKYNNMLLSRPVDDRIPDVEAIITPNPIEFINKYKEMFRQTLLKCDRPSSKLDRIPIKKTIQKPKHRILTHKKSRFGIIDKTVYPIHFDHKSNQYYYNK